MRFVLCFRVPLPLFVDPSQWVVAFEYVLIAILMLHQVRLLHLFIHACEEVYSISVNPVPQHIDIDTQMK